jgi:hypothetical protein
MRTVIITLILTLLSGSVSAGIAKVKNPFDGKRTGFIFGMSTGGGVTWVKSRNVDVSGEHTLGTVALTDRLGFGVNDRVQIYGLIASSVYAYKLWEHYEGAVDESGSAAAYIAFLPALPIIAMFTDQHTVMGVGVTWYLAPQAPCWYVDLAIGGSLCADPDEEDNPSVHPGFNADGLGIFTGIGYEVNRNFMVGLNLMYGREEWETDTGGEKSWSAVSAMLTIGFVAY